MLSSRNERLKASDVFAGSHFLLGEKVSFVEAFPLIEKLEVAVIEDGDDVPDWIHERHYTQDSVGEYVDCHNPRCYNGGVRIGDQLRFMVTDRETDREFTAPCQGYEGSPKGRKNYGPCFNRFQVLIHIQYKPEGAVRA